MPTWLVAIGIAVALAVHVALLLRPGTYVTSAGALAFAALVIVAKHLGVVRWPRRQAQDPDSASAHEDETSP
ncbi:hypothetical protein [Rhodanobacter terrae]|uniref:Uncharacterized protein n=1 Tax=Rhodanobacter terrae TaxID=418647 RepID=A0ABW0SYH4_9GAMM